VILYDPIGTIIRVCIAAVLAGLVWSAVAVTVIHTGSTRLTPRLPARMIWKGWRRKRMIWGLGLTLPLLGTILMAEVLARRIGMVDIYWMAREEPLLWIGRLAGMCGYLVVLLVVVVVALIRQKRAAKATPNTSNIEA